MARVPLLAIAGLLACVGGVGYVYLQSPVAMSITEDLSELGAGAAISVPPSTSVVDVEDLR